LPSGIAEIGGMTGRALLLEQRRTIRRLRRRERHLRRRNLRVQQRATKPEPDSQPK